MAFLEIKNVRIAGIAAGVPDTIVRNTDGHVQSEDYNADEFVESTGVVERRFTNKLTTGDLCYAAAEKLRRFFNCLDAFAIHQTEILFSKFTFYLMFIYHHLNCFIILVKNCFYCTSFFRVSRTIHFQKTRTTFF